MRERVIGHIWTLCSIHAGASDELKLTSRLSRALYFNSACTISCSNFDSASISKCFWASNFDPFKSAVFVRIKTTQCRFNTVLLWCNVSVECRSFGLSYWRVLRADKYKWVRSYWYWQDILPLGSRTHRSPLNPREVDHDVHRSFPISLVVLVYMLADYLHF